MNTEYHVRLDAFEGPLDLLLFLIRRAEVEITDIPIATIADQYLEYLGSIDTIDVDRAGEFLVLAATLTEIKARMLAPPPQPEPGVEGADGADGGDKGAIRQVDPRAELVQQLLEYKRYRDAAEALDQRKSEWEARYPIAAATPAIPSPPAQEGEAGEGDGPEGGAGVDVEDVSLADLIEAFSRILATVDLNRVGEHRVVVDDTPIELHAEDLLDRLRREMEESRAGGVEWRGLTLQRVFMGRTRGEAIGLFLAMLELVRQRKIEVVQEAPRGEILIRPAAGDAPAGEAQASGETPAAGT